MTVVRLTATAIAAAFVACAAPAIANTPPPPPAPPAEEVKGVAPDIYVLSIYHTKIESESVSPEMGAASTDSLILMSFTPDLLALYKKALDLSANEPIIDGDVFWGAQDWDTKEVATKTTANDGKTATVEVTFKIAGEDRKVTLALKQFADAWQVDDITTGAGSMRQWLTEATTPK